MAEIFPPIRVLSTGLSHDRESIGVIGTCRMKLSVNFIFKMLFSVYFNFSKNFRRLVCTNWWKISSSLNLTKYLIFIFICFHFKKKTPQKSNYVLIGGKITLKYEKDDGEKKNKNTQVDLALIVHPTTRENRCKSFPERKRWRRYNNKKNTGKVSGEAGGKTTPPFCRQSNRRRSLLCVR